MATNSSKSGGSTDEIGKENGKSTFIPGDPGSTDFLSAKVQNAVDTGKTPLKTAANVYITMGRDGIWFEDAATANGVRDGTEALITAVTDANGDGYFTINGVNMAADNVTLRVVDGTAAVKLDLAGFGAGDKIILDGRTNQSDYFGLSGNFDKVSFVPFITDASTFLAANIAWAGVEGYASNGLAGAALTYDYAEAYLSVRSGRLLGYWYNSRSAPGFYGDSSGTNVLAIGLVGAINATGYAVEAISPVPPPG